MSGDLLIVLSNPVTGKEREFDEWYGQQHLPQMMTVPGFINAQRFRIVPANGEAPYQHLALYGIGPEGSEFARRSLDEARTTILTPSDAIDRSRLGTWFFSPIGEPIAAR